MIYHISEGLNDKVSNNLKLYIEYIEAANFLGFFFLEDLKSEV